ncbi:MAG: hypothetical protein ACKOZT_03850 [Cyanobium sp.]
MPTVSSPPQLVLLTLGASADPDGPARLLPVVAERLGALSGLPLQTIPEEGSPQAALAALHGCAGPWLAPLRVDPGLPLPGGHWAGALGAWRQPCLLVMPPSRLATGLPAAGHALLVRCGVPLAGLIQWGGSWDAGERRDDGLPWLGWLEAREPTEPDQPTDADAALLAALQRRWRALKALLA